MVNKNKLIWILLGAIVIVSVLIILVINSGIFKSENNVDEVIQQCNLVCSTNNDAGYCDLQLKLIAKDLPNDLESKKGTCDFFSTSEEYLKYGVAKCPELQPCHTKVIDQTCVTGLGGNWEQPLEDGSCAPGEIMRKVKVTPSDNPPEQGMICCA